MSVKSTAHINFRGDARAALEFYQSVFGGQMTVVTFADAHNVYGVPDDLPLADAAALLIAYQTAVIGLWRRAQLRSHDVLLVHGASGGVGTAALQLGAAIGCRVIAVAGGPDKAARCRTAGATDVIDHRAVDDLGAAVSSLTDGRGVDVVFDPVGGAALEASLGCVAVDARVLIVGFAGGEIASVATNRLLYKSCSLMGVYVGAYSRDAAGRAYLHEVWDDIVGLYRRRDIRPAIDLTVPFAEAPAALDALADRRTTGKVIVDVRAR